MPPALHRSVCTSGTANVPIGHTHRLLSRTVRPGVLFYGARLARTHAFACRHARCQFRGLHTVSAPPLSRNSSTTRTPNAISLAQWPCQVALQSRRARCSILTRASREDHGLPHSTQSQTANDADIEFAEQMLEEVVQAELGGLTGGGQPISIFSSLDMADMDAIILELGPTVAESAPSPARANDGHSDPVLSTPSPSEVSQSAGFQAATDTAAGGGAGIGDETAGDVGESKAVAWEQASESSAAAAAELPGKLDTWPALKTVAGLLRPDLGLVFATIIALLSAVFSFLAIPLAIGHFFEVVRTAGQALDPMAAYRPAATILGVSLIFGALANASLTSLTAWIGERFGARLKARLFRIIMARDQTYFDEIQKGELIARLTVDVSRMSAAVADNLGQRGVRSLLEVLGAVIVIARLNPGLAVVALALTPLLSRLTRVIVVRTARLAYRQQTAASDAIKFADERLSQARTVRVFAQEDAEVERFDGLLGATYRLAKQAAWLQGVTDGGGRMTINISSLAVLTVGGLLVLKGRLSVGSMLAINVYNTFLAVGLAQLAGSLGDLGRSLGSLQRVMDVLGVTSPATDAGGSTRLPNVKGNLEFKDVHFAYAGRQDLPVLSGMSLKVPAGSSMALVGSSGSGKSTAVALLLRLYEPSSGSILLDGWEVSDMDVQWLRSKVAVVSQEPSLLAGTVADAIRYGRPDASLEEVQTAARAANAHEFIEALPQGYETLVGERGSSLSGGQKQRIAIARAILMDAKVLLLDEATSALDVESEALVSAALKVLMVGRTTLIIAHRLSTVRQADRIAVIAHGKVAEEGTHLQLMQKQDGLYRGFVHQSEASAEAWDSLNGAAAPQIQPMIQAPA